MKKFEGFRVVVYLVLTICALATVFPLIPLLFASLKNVDEFQNTGSLTPPTNWFNFHNFTVS